MELLISHYSWIGNPHVYVHVGREGRGWEWRDVAALAPWWDEKLSKPGEQENTGRAKVKLLRPQRERRNNPKLFLVSSGRVCVWSNWGLSVKTELLYMKCAFSATENFWATCEKLPDSSDLVLHLVFHCTVSLTSTISEIFSTILFYVFCTRYCIM